jgi:DNA-binding NarL/FixJ family response regulator
MHHPNDFRITPCGVTRTVSRNSTRSFDWGSFGFAMTIPGEILIVEDQPLVARQVATVAARFAVARIVGTVEAARAVLAGKDPLGAAIIDLGLPDGSGFDVVEVAREERGELPILVLTGHNDPDVINRANLLRAEFVCKQDWTENVESFLRRVEENIARGHATP